METNILDIFTTSGRDRTGVYGKDGVVEGVKEFPVFVLFVGGGWMGGVPVLVLARWERVVSEFMLGLLDYFGCACNGLVLNIS